MIKQEKRPTSNPFGGDGEEKEEFKIIGKKKVDPKIKEMVEAARKKNKRRSICGC